MNEDVVVRTRENIDYIQHQLKHSEIEADKDSWHNSQLKNIVDRVETLDTSKNWRIQDSNRWDLIAELFDGDAVELDFNQVTLV